MKTRIRLLLCALVFSSLRVSAAKFDLDISISPTDQNIILAHTGTTTLTHAGPTDGLQIMNFSALRYLNFAYLAFGERIQSIALEVSSPRDVSKFEPMYEVGLFGRRQFGTWQTLKTEYRVNFRAEIARGESEYADTLLFREKLALFKGILSETERFLPIPAGIKVNDLREGWEIKVNPPDFNVRGYYSAHYANPLGQDTNKEQAEFVKMLRTELGPQAREVQGVDAHSTSFFLPKSAKLTPGAVIFKIAHERAERILTALNQRGSRNGWSSAGKPTLTLSFGNKSKTCENAVGQ